MDASMAGDHQGEDWSTRAKSISSLLPQPFNFHQPSSTTTTTQSTPPPPPSLLSGNTTTTNERLDQRPAKKRKRADLVTIKQQLAQLLEEESHSSSITTTGGGEEDLSQLYWNNLKSFVVGKITRSELGDVLEKCFKGNRQNEAINLHNALLLSILYNTTRPTLPSSSIRHSGFHPRGKKRSSAVLLIEGEGRGAEARRKMIKDTVMRIGKRERAELKLLGSNASVPSNLGGGVGKRNGNASMVGGGNEGSNREYYTAGEESIGQAFRASRGGGGEIVEGVPKLLKDRERQGTRLPTNFTQEYDRLVQTPICCESRVLPDANTLRDRMALIAYEEGMVDGVDGGVSSLLAGAIDHYIKQMLSSAVSLVRDPSRRLNPQPLEEASSPSTFAPAGPSPSNPPPVENPPEASPSRPSRKPLSISDFHALFAIQPSLLGPNGSTHSGAVERMYALPPQSDSEDSGEESVDDEDGDGRTGQVSSSKDTAGDVKMALDDPPPNVPTSNVSIPISAVSGKMPRLSTSRNRALSFYGSVRPVEPIPPSTAATPGLADRSKFLLDPTSLHGVPEGHPDVPHVPSTVSSIMPPLVPPPLSHTQSSISLQGTNATGGGTTTNNPPISPKSLSLRNSLFPELASTNPSTSSSSTSANAVNASGANAAATNGVPKKGSTTKDQTGNGTTTDEADSEFDELVDKIATNTTTTGSGSGKTKDKKSNLTASTNSTTGGGGGLKIKLGGQTTGTITPSPAPTSAAANTSAGGATGGNKNAVQGVDKDKELGRKLWEVVDSVRLLDGVLPP